MDSFTQFVMMIAPYVGYFVLFLAACAVALVLLALCLRGVIVIMRQSQELRYGLIGVCGAKQMEADVRRHLGKLVEKEAIRIVNKMYETGELPKPKCEQCKNPHHDGICTCGRQGKEMK